MFKKFVFAGWCGCVMMSAFAADGKLPLVAEKEEVEVSNDVHSVLESFTSDSAMISDPLAIACDVDSYKEQIDKCFRFVEELKKREAEAALRNSKVQTRSSPTTGKVSTPYASWRKTGSVSNRYEGWFKKK